MNPRRWIDSREYDFEEGESGIHSVLGDVGPECESSGERGEEDDPVNYRDQEGVGGYAGVEEVVEGLEGSRKSVEKGCSSVYGVREGMKSGDGKVAGGAPVTENCRKN